MTAVPAVPPTRLPALPVPRQRRQVTVAATPTRARWGWLALLLSSICFEALGRKFITAVPSVVFYFLKDFVLLAGLARFGLPMLPRQVAKRLYGPFVPVMVAAVAWTVVQCFNPSVRALWLGVLGLRSYWLWWLCPLVIAGYMRTTKDLERGVAVLAAITAVVALFAIYQYSRPSTDSINTYALYEGQEVNDVDTVRTTGRVRVSSTFSYLSGFVDFMMLIPLLLLSLGLGMSRGRVRNLSMVAFALSVMALPMSGSRSALILPVLGMMAVLWSSGVLRSKQGRRVALGGGVAVLAGVLASTDAIGGVLSRFDDAKESRERLMEALLVLPPVALSELHYPALGTGTGTQSNAAMTLRLASYQAAEGEPSRLLVELGPPGYLLVWTARLGLVLALLSSWRRLRRAGMGALGGAALALAGYTLIGPLYGDHVFFSLYFVALGFVLHGVKLAMQSTVSPPRPAPLVRPAPIRQRPLPHRLPHRPPLPAVGAKTPSSTV